MWSGRRSPAALTMRRELRSSTLSRLIEWRHLLIVVKPDTLIRWHRKGFQLFWRWKSRPRGRPRLPVDLQRLIARHGDGESHVG